MSKKNREAKGGKDRRHWSLIPPIEFTIYCGLRFLLAFTNLLPYSAVPFFGRVLGRILQVVDRKHRRIALKNLKLSPEIVPPETIPQVMRKVYDNAGIAMVEMFMLPTLLRRGQLANTFDLQGMDIFDRALEKGKGCIVVVGHQGNYELGGIVIASQGYPLNSLARPIPNRYIDKYVTSIRSQTGNKIIPTNRAIVEMLRVLRRNEILVVEIDMDAKYDGILVDFCGRPASTYRSPALFAIKCGAPVVLATCSRVDDKNICKISDPIYADEFKGREDGIEEMLKLICRRFDESVRKQPDQWLWLLDRWRGAEKLIRRQTEEKARAQEALSEKNGEPEASEDVETDAPAL
jgi:Kdo2-lipid IVA lauroyltransferase/acyltransferase